MRLFTAAICLALGATQLHGADARLLALLMPEPRLLGGMHLDRAKASPFGQFLLSQAAPGAELDRIKSATGFDPRTDLSEVVVAAGADGQGLAAGRGAFQPARLAELAAAAGTPLASYRGVTLIGGPAVVAFLDGSTVLLGEAPLVRAAIDRWISSAALSPTVAAHAAELGAASEAWAVLTGVSQLGSDAAKPLPPALHNILSRIDRVSGQLSLGNTITVNGLAATHAPQDAQDLAAAFQLLVAMLAAQVPGAPVPQSRADGSSVRFTLTLTEQQIEDVLRSKPLVRGAVRK